MPQSRLLLAENDPSLSRALATRLKYSGWLVDEVSSGESAVAAVRERPPDVVLLDLRLSGMDGLDVLRQLHTLPVRPPVVLMSGYLDPESTRAAVMLGAVEVLEKPVLPQHLCAVLDEVAKRSSDEGAVERADAASIPELVGPSRAMTQLRSQLVAMARYRELPVLIVGETGTGKELVAQALHRLSDPGKPIVALNCAAVPESLFESELFGHAAGTFTGATGARTGLLESAGDGTIFLDEVGELSAVLQSKLLRMLETRRFRPLGSNRELPVRARIVSATNRELDREPNETFRRDLYYRLAGYTVRTPPLRERMEDLPTITNHLLPALARQIDQTVSEISPQALLALQTHDWPGNVRELRGTLLAATVHANGRIEVRHVLQAMERSRKPQVARAPSEGGNVLDDIERDAVARAYASCSGNLTHAAKMLGIPRTTMRDKVRRYRLS